MDTENKGVESPAIASTQPVVVTDTDYEAQIAALKAREAKLTEERDNYKVGMLKYKGKSRDEFSEDEDTERIKLAAKEALAESHLADIARELDSVNKTLLKENKELKAAHSNKNTMPPASSGSSTDAGAPVRDNSISPDQMAYFKSRGWDDKKIAQYKKNLQKRA